MQKFHCIPSSLQEILLKSSIHFRKIEKNLRYKMRPKYLKQKLMVESMRQEEQVQGSLKNPNRFFKCGKEIPSDSKGD